MRKIFSTLILASAACSGFAADYYWNFTGGWWGNWSANFTKDSGTNGNPAATDNVIFNANEYFGKEFINDKGATALAKSTPYLVVETKTVANMTFEDLFYTNDTGTEVGQSIEIRGSKTTENGTFTSQTLNITGDLVAKFSKYQSHAVIKGNNESSRRAFNVNIGGSIIVGGQSGANSNASLIIGASGSATEYVDSLNVGGDVNFNGGQLVFNVGKDGVSTLSNPDVDIKGVFYYNTTGSWAIAQRGAGMTGDSYVQLGGLHSLSAGSKISNAASSTSAGNTYLVFNNASGVTCNYSGWLREYNSGARNLSLIMKGDGEQTIYETSRSSETQFNEFMRGSITVYNGTLQVGSEAGVYAKLNLEGGRFSAYGDNMTVGVFTVKDVDWKSGTLLVNVNDYAEADLVSIENNLNGLAAQGSKYMIEIISDIELENTEYKIVEWGGTNNISISDLVSNLDNLYDISFEIRNSNELWAVIGAAIPEPSTYAFLMGALALVLVAHRRKN